MAQADAAFWTSLKPAFRGEVETDTLTRGRYATDASIYQAFPAGVAFPQTEADVKTILSLANRHRIAVAARGSGTSTAGQCVSEGVILDFSRHMKAVVEVDAATQTCVVQPGLTLAALNAALAPQELQFPVSVTNARQATLGGMFANNTRGLRVLRYGRMAANVTSVQGVLADGQTLHFGASDGDAGAGNRLLDLLQLGELHEKDITSLWPEAAASKPTPPGYNLRAILPSKENQNFAHLLAGSEGTLAIVTALHLKLIPRLQNTALGICRFADLQTALRATPAIVARGASVVELLERQQLRAPVSGTIDRFLQAGTSAFLLVEFDEENPVENTRLLKELDGLLDGFGKKALGVSEVIGRQAQNAVWREYRETVTRDLGVRNSARPISLIEDPVMPVDRLADYHASVSRLLGSYGLSYSTSGSAGSGCLQIRPVLDMSQGRDLDRIRVISEGVVDLVLKYGGSITGGYGLGLSRSEIAETLRGPVASNLCAQVKAILDPRGILNPGKIVKAPRFDDPALFRRTDNAAGAGTSLVWDNEATEKAAQDHAARCSGLSVCIGTPPRFSCPSEAVTRKERDSPRGRANSVRMARTGMLGQDALGSDAMIETMRLCVSCKACRSACPSSIDIAKMKADVLSIGRLRGRRSRAEDVFARLPVISDKIQPWRRFVNLRDWIPGLPRLAERITGLSADRAWPRFSGRPYRTDPRSNSGHRGQVALFADTFNQSFEPANLRAAANIFHSAGYNVSLLTDGRAGRGLCCGRTFYDAGYIDEARSEAHRLLAAVADYGERGIPVIGLEPACVLMLRDEYGALGLQPNASQTIVLFDEFISQLIAKGEFVLPFKTVEADCVLHPHCHERAWGIEVPSETALKTVPGLSVQTVKPTCCGFNGMVGLTAETLEPSLAMAELALFPAIRKAGRDALVSATGFTCRRQIQDGLGVTARHPAMILDLALKSVSEIVA